MSHFINCQEKIWKKVSITKNYQMSKKLMLFCSYTTTFTPFDVALRRLVTHQTREKAKWARPHLGQDWGCCHIFENWAFILPSFRLRLHSSNRSQSRPSRNPLLITCLFASCKIVIRSVMRSKFRVHQLPGKTSLIPINYFMRWTHFLRSAQGQIWGWGIRIYLVYFTKCISTFKFAI